MPLASLVRLVMRVEFRVFQMTQNHQRGEVNF